MHACFWQLCRRPLLSRQLDTQPTQQRSLWILRLHCPSGLQKVTAWHLRQKKKHRKISERTWMQPVLCVSGWQHWQGTSHYITLSKRGHVMECNERVTPNVTSHSKSKSAKGTVEANSSTFVAGSVHRFQAWLCMKRHPEYGAGSRTRESHRRCLRYPSSSTPSYPATPNLITQLRMTITSSYPYIQHQQLLHPITPLPPSVSSLARPALSALRPRLHLALRL
jgi:hypothetical protein